MEGNHNIENRVHRDVRGEIWGYEIEGLRFNVMSTKAGALRGGDYHSVTQYDLVLKGELEGILRQDDQDITFRKGPNEVVAIPPDIPHLLRSITDTAIIAWWDGPFKAEYYEPYRRQVEEQFKQPI